MPSRFGGRQDRDGEAAAAAPSLSDRGAMHQSVAEKYSNREIVFRLLQQCV